MKTALHTEMQGSNFISSFHRFFHQKNYEALFVALRQMCQIQKVSVCKGFGARFLLNSFVGDRNFQNNRWPRLKKLNG